MSIKFNTDFKEVKSLGSGVSSTVFEAVSLNEGKSYAVKKIPFKKEDQEKTLKEINILSSLNACFVVLCTKWWIEDNYYIGSFDKNNSQNISSGNLLFSPNDPLLLHIQMELCSMTLYQFIEEMVIIKANKLSNEQYGIACEILLQLLECVQYLHSLKPQIIHRDLKPENIMLILQEVGYKVKLTDFGLSTYHTYIDHSHTKYVGTTSYRAPEVDKRQYDTKADIFSLGKIMEKLFNLDIDSDENDINVEIESKYENAKQICSRCVSYKAKKRPDCQYIINARNLWFYKDNKSKHGSESNNEDNTGLSFSVLLEKWPFLNKIKRKLLFNCKKISIIEEIEEKVIFSTSDKNIYAFRVSDHIDSLIQEPYFILELTNKEIQTIVCGFCHVLCLTKNKHVYSFGENVAGQLGNGTNIRNNKPSIIKALLGKNIIDIKCGAYHSLALSKSGRVFSWGSGRFGQLGNGLDSSKNTPVEVSTLNNENIVSISCGYSHCLALSKSGTLYSWGNNVRGQLGIGNFYKQNKPIALKFGKGIVIVKISCGREHSLVLTSANIIYSFGHNLYGQLGFKNRINYNTPTRLETTIKFIDIETTFYHNLSFGLSLDHIFYVWGECYDQSTHTPKQTNFNSFYETFIYYSLNYKVVPTIIINELLIKSKNSFMNKFNEWSIFKILDQKILSQIISFSIVRIKENKAILVTNDEMVYSFRLNDSIDCLAEEPVVISELKNKKIKNIICGLDFVLCLTENYEVYSFGDNLNGQLGNGTRINNYKPIMITGLCNKQITELCCGKYHCLALSDSGNLYVWGSGHYGQNCNDLKTFQLTPIEIETLIDVKCIAITCGSHHCLALTSYHILIGWGHNRYGQLGLGNNDNQYKPIPIDVPFKVEKLVCGKYHSLLLSNDHDIYSFGQNHFGQLGRDNRFEQNKIHKIEIEIKFVDIYATFYDDISAGLSQTGEYYVWGKCGDQVITVPKLTEFTSFDEIFIRYSNRGFLSKEMIFYDK